MTPTGARGRRQVRDSVINGVKVRETHAVLTASEVIREIEDLPPGSVYRFRCEGKAEAYTYLRVITRPEYEQWEP